MTNDKNDEMKRAKQEIKRLQHVLKGLETENERLENSEERCNSDLRDQKTSLASVEERYNALKSLFKSEFVFHEVDFFYFKHLCQ